MPLSFFVTTYSALTSESLAHPHPTSTTRPSPDWPDDFPSHLGISGGYTELTRHAEFSIPMPLCTLIKKLCLTDECSPGYVIELLEPITLSYQGETFRFAIGTNLTITPGGAIVFASNCVQAGPLHCGNDDGDSPTLNFWEGRMFSAFYANNEPVRLIDYSDGEAITLPLMSWYDETSRYRTAGIFFDSPTCARFGRYDFAAQPKECINLRDQDALEAVFRQSNAVLGGFEYIAGNE